jgi:hypothetical protein
MGEHQDDRCCVGGVGSRDTQGSQSKPCVAVVDGDASAFIAVVSVSLEAWLAGH